MTRERIEDFREIVLPFVGKRLLETNYENLGESDAEEFEKDFNEILDMAIQALEQEPKTGHWIPVNERLPEKLKDVLVAFYDCPDEYDVAYLRTTFNETYKKNGAKNEWVSSMGETTYADYEVDAWKPIEPYKAESEG